MKIYKNTKILGIIILLLMQINFNFISAVTNVQTTNYEEYMLGSENHVYLDFSNNSAFIFENNVKSYINTVGYNVSMYMEVDNTMNNHEIEILINDNTFIETYLNSSDLEFDINMGSVYRDDKNERYIFNSGFCIYVSSNQSFSLSYKTINENYHFFSVYYDEFTYSLQFMKVDSYHHGGYLRTNVLEGTSYYFIVESDELSDNIIFIVGSGLGFLSMIGIGVIFKETKQEKKKCLPPKELINGKCVDWDTYFKNIRNL